MSTTRVFDSFRDFYSEKIEKFNFVLKEYLKTVTSTSLGGVQDGNSLIELRTDLTAWCELSSEGTGHWTVFRFIIDQQKIYVTGSAKRGLIAFPHSLV